MANEFDLERAKRGDAVQTCAPRGAWIDCYYVGIAISGNIVIQIAPDSRLHTVECNSIRMKPKEPRTMWVQLYDVDCGANVTACSNAHSDPASVKKWCYERQLKPIGEPQSVLVPDES